MSFEARCIRISSEAFGVHKKQSLIGSCSPFAGEVPEVLRLRIRQVGRQNPGEMVYAYHVIVAGTAETHSLDAAFPPDIDFELIPGARHNLSIRRGRLQRKDKTDYRKSVRISHL